MISLLLSIFVAAESLKLYPATRMDWSPDRPVLAVQGWLREDGPKRVRGLFLQYERENRRNPINLETPYDDVSALCRDVSDFFWGDEGFLGYVVKEWPCQATSRVEENKTARWFLVIVEVTEEDVHPRARYQLDSTFWQGVYLPQLMYGATTLIFAYDEGNGNSLRLLDLATHPAAGISLDAGHSHRLPTTSASQGKNRALYPYPKAIHSLTRNPYGGQSQQKELLLFSAQLDSTSAYKLYALAADTREVLNRARPRRVTGAGNLNEHFGKLDPTGRHVAFYGMRGDRAVVELYRTTFPGGMPKRVDQLRDGSLEGLLGDSSILGTYAWNPDGSDLYYLLRSDRENDPIMIRDAALSSDERRHPSRMTHRMMDISPVTGRLAYVADTPGEGERLVFAARDEETLLSGETPSWNTKPPGELEQAIPAFKSLFIDLTRFYRADYRPSREEGEIGRFVFTPLSLGKETENGVIELLDRLGLSGQLGQSEEIPGFGKSNGMGWTLALSDGSGDVIVLDHARGYEIRLPSEMSQLALLPVRNAQYLFWGDGKTPVPPKLHLDLARTLLYLSHRIQGLQLILKHEDLRVNKRVRQRIFSQLATRYGDGSFSNLFVADNGSYLRAPLLEGVAVSSSSDLSSDGQPLPSSPVNRLLRDLEQEISHQELEINRVEWKIVPQEAKKISPEAEKPPPLADVKLFIHLTQKEP